MIHFYFIIFYYFPLYIKNSLIPVYSKIGNENLLFPKKSYSTIDLDYYFIAINKTIIGYFNEAEIETTIPTSTYIEQNTRHISINTSDHILANNKYVTYKCSSNYYTYNISSQLSIDIPNDVDPLIISKTGTIKFALVSLIYPSENYLTKFLEYENSYFSNIKNLSVCENSQTLKNIRCNNTIYNSIVYSSCAAICDNKIYIFVLDVENMIKYTENIEMSKLSASNQVRIFNFHFHDTSTKFLVVSYTEDKIFEIEYQKFYM